jgi:hypothetical protein
MTLARMPGALVSAESSTRRPPWGLLLAVFVIVSLAVYRVAAIRTALVNGSAF